MPPGGSVAVNNLSSNLQGGTRIVRPNKSAKRNTISVPSATARVNPNAVGPTFPRGRKLGAAAGSSAPRKRRKVAGGNILADIHRHLASGEGRAYPQVEGPQNPSWVKRNAAHQAKIAAQMKGGGAQEVAGRMMGGATHPMHHIHCLKCKSKTPNRHGALEQKGRMARGMCDQCGGKKCSITGAGFWDSLKDIGKKAWGGIKKAGGWAWDNKEKIADVAKKALEAGKEIKSLAGKGLAPPMKGRGAAGISQWDQMMAMKRAAKKGGGIYAPGSSKGKGLYTPGSKGMARG